MMKLSPIAAAICAVGCSQQSQSSQSEPAQPRVPIRFALACSAPTGAEIPDAAATGFKVVVDRSNNRISFPWEEHAHAIGKIASNEIILIDEHVDRGIDGNPEDRKATFNLGSGTLHYQESYSGFIPVNRDFSSKCKILNGATA